MIDPISWAHSWPYLAAALAAGYLLGSIPFGLLLTRFAGFGDIRVKGSGNIGASNVLRSTNKKLAALTLLLDGGKGAVAVLIAQNWGPDITIVAAGGALIGHMAPVWLRLRGGKGVATAIGVFLALAWPVGVLMCLTWLAVAAATRYSSLSALIAMAAAPAFAWWLADPQRMEFAIFTAILVWLSHISNIRRLLSGAETRIGERD